MTRLRTLLLLSTCFVATLLPLPARAELKLSFDSPFSNTTVPFGSDPWLTAVLDSLDAHNVQLTLTANLQSSSEYISNVYFNVAGLVSDVHLILPVTGSAAPALVGFAIGSDTQPADGGGYYDIRLQFETAGGPSHDRFTGSEVLQLVFNRASGLTESDFNVLAAPHGGNGPFLAAAHVQGIATATGTGSTFLAPGTNVVPEPAPIVLSAVMVLLLLGKIRRARTA